MTTTATNNQTTTETATETTMVTYELEVQIPITLPGSVIKYNFKTTDADIAFGVVTNPTSKEANGGKHNPNPNPYANGGSGDGGGGERELIPIDRVDSHLSPISGVVRCPPPPCTVTLCFDNHYSWFSSKTLSYTAVLQSMADMSSMGEIVFPGKATRSSKIAPLDETNFNASKSSGPPSESRPSCSVSPPLTPTESSENFSQVTPDLDDETFARLRDMLTGKSTLGANLQSKIFEAFWSVGCEPDFTIARELHSLSSARSKISLFRKVLEGDCVTEDVLTRKVLYFRKMKRLPERPEGPEEPFKLQTARGWFFRRLAGACIPFGPYFMGTDRLFPQYTEREKAVLRVSRSSLALVLGVSESLWLVNFVLVATGSIDSITVTDNVISVLLLVLLITSQVYRESRCWSVEGLRSEAAYQFERFLLHYIDDFTSERGEKCSGLKVVAQMMDDCRFTESQVSILMTPSSHVYALKQLNLKLKGEKRRRSSMDIEVSSLLEACQKTSEMDKGQAKENELYDRRFALNQLSLNKILPLVIAVFAGLVPPAMRYVMANERSLFDASGNGLETFAQVMEILFYSSLIYAYTVVVLSDSINDTEIISRMARWAQAFLKDASESESLTIRLFNGRNVLAFRTMHRFMFSTYACYAQYHLAAFEVASLVAIFSSALVFAMSILDVKLNVGMATLLGMGTVITAVMTYIFYKTSKAHSILVKNVVRGLTAQRRRNNIEVDYIETMAKSKGSAISAGDAETINELNKATKMIHDLCEEIVDEHAPVKLWNILPLTKDNILKLAGALAASLFTTGLRLALKS
ncbi:hypothetical protein TrRE_jg3219 [Triparma retinervis]|uniref:Transmembrane protein n=1 Tax=Triparma retinervis TaxID=2557542 RepID=A0A9W7DWZ9_9STRA|nr:hypothetical protein TrRE_jg3219 [Triparma retinervis]